MLIIAKGEHWDRKEYDKLVEEAVSRYPYYYPIYFSALEYLLPKWHGSDDEVIRFIESTVERTKKSEGQVMYARMYWYAIDNVTDSSPYVRSPVIWAKIRSGMDEVLARYPDQWNINNFAKFACYAVDKEKGKELFNRIEGEPILSVWGDINYYTIWKNMMTGSQDPVDINQFGKIGQI